MRPSLRVKFLVRLGRLRALLLGEKLPHEGMMEHRQFFRLTLVRAHALRHQELRADGAQILGERLNKGECCGLVEIERLEVQKQRLQG